MNILDYKNFKSDVFKYMNSLIEKYDLKMPLDTKVSSELEVWLENKKCKIYLNALAYFPHQGVGFEFYVKAKNEFTKVSSQDIYAKLGFDDNEMNAFINNYFKETVFFSDSEFKTYQQSLKLNEKLIIRYYMPLVYENNNT